MQLQACWIDLCYQGFILLGFFLPPFYTHLLILQRKSVCTLIYLLSHHLTLLEKHVVHANQTCLYKVVFKTSYKLLLCSISPSPPPSIIIQIYLTYLRDAVKSCNLSCLWAKLIGKKIPATTEKFASTFQLQLIYLWGIIRSQNIQCERNTGTEQTLKQIRTFSPYSLLYQTP